MFKTMSTDNKPPVGKLNDWRSRHDKGTHYNRGSDNEMVGASSTASRIFVDHGPQQVVAKIPPQPVSVTMGDFPTTYESDAKKAFKGPPAE